MTARTELDVKPSPEAIARLEDHCEACAEIGDTLHAADLRALLDYYYAKEKLEPRKEN